uniref:Uncharacterized protein n=1 Tax=Cacopsylla melanoneura TaxID=428564 RepID=A0A8D8W8T5_9HEMI
MIVRYFWPQSRQTIPGLIGFRVLLIASFFFINSEVGAATGGGATVLILLVAWVTSCPVRGRLLERAGAVEPYRRDVKEALGVASPGLEVTLLGVGVCLSETMLPPSSSLSSSISMTSHWGEEDGTG